ncbi:autotransporter domain-containing protein [Variovorax sp. MHTC-1]|uniref:autotransporter outer membrane beta-barrel domain-containing protein n=1 Tax=Variovorax sp. MHTC-1 TaxID=2495593 RepID=UPI00163C8201|nr:autotransporter domain-containing protein [Variovorax sp. MHTC-1]
MLNITSGGTLTTTGNAAMFRRGGNSTANVSGAGSQWSVGGSLIVGSGITSGSSGISVLNVDNGGAVTVAGPVSIGGVSLSTRGLGALTLTGAGSQLSSGGALNIGQWGTGTLTVSNGAVATASTVTLGASVSGSGTLNLLGGSTLASQALTGGTGVMRQANFDGGTLRATGSNTAFITGFGGTELNIAAGGLTLDTAGFDVTAASPFSGVGALTKTGLGTAVLTGDNSYTGGTTISAGTLQLGNGGASGSITGDVANNGTLAFDRSDAYTYGGRISGTGAVRQIGTGTTILTGNNTHTGGTAIDGGTLQVAGDANLGDASGALSFDGGTLQNTAAFGSARAVTLGTGGGSFQADTDLALSGVIGGTGALTKTGDGTLILSSANTYTGGTTVSAGTLQIGNGGTSGSITGDVTNNGTLAFNRSNRLDFDGAISGAGAIRQIGSGFTNLTGNSAAFTGTTTVEAGTLAVNGVLGGSANVLAAGRLQGSGTVGNLTVAGTVAPGNSIGTLTVNGNYSQAAGSTYQVEVGPASTVSDLIHATGSASVASGATLQVVRTSSAGYSLDNRYTVLTADGGVTGTYSLKGDTQSAFVQLVDSYDANHVYLSAQKVRSFTDAAATPNQVAVSTALESLPDDHGLVQAVAWLPNDFAARDAFNQLSVDIHASNKTAMLEDSRFVREAAIDRLRTAACAPGSASAAPQQPSEGCTPADNQARTAWSQVFGSWGHIDGNGDAAKLKRDIGGFVVGADTGVGAGWRVGGLGGYSRASADTDARNSSAKTDSYHLGLYGSTQWGATALRLGASHSWNKTDTSRSVAFAGFADSVSAQYDSTTTQLFGEVGHRIEAGTVALEPFAGLAHVLVKNDAFFERGGLAALYGEGGSVDATFTTLGLRASAQLGTATRLRGMLGWRHAFGDTTPTSTHAFGGSLPFTIAGVPLAKNVAVLEAGVETQLRPNLTLGASYSGQFGDGRQDHGFKVNLNWAF